MKQELTMMAVFLGITAVLFGGIPACNNADEEKAFILSAVGPVGEGGGPGAGAGGSAGASGEAGSSGAAGNASSKTRLRMANFVPGTEAVDFCVKESSAADYSQAKKLFASLMGDPSLAYPKVSKPVEIDATGNFDVKVVAGSSADCTGAALAEKTGVALVPTSQTLSVLYQGGNGVTPEVGVFPETNPRDKGVLLRFVHSSPGAGALDVGLVVDPMLPTTLAVAVFSNIAFGKASPAGVSPSGFPIDDNGYVVLDSPLSTQNVGASLTGVADALVARSAEIGPDKANLTAYGIGIVGDTTTPLVAMVCQDNDEMGVYTVCTP
jgi:hypothetical protein